MHEPKRKSQGETVLKTLILKKNFLNEKEKGILNLWDAAKAVFITLNACIRMS